MRLDSSENLIANSLIKPHIALIRKETPQDLNLHAFPRHDRNHHLGCKMRRRSIKSDGHDRIAVKSAIGSLLE